MARKLLELDTGDGNQILVAVDVPLAAVGKVANVGEIPVERVEQTFDTIRDLVIRSCRPLNQAFRTLQREGQASEAEVEFGVNFTTKGNIYVVESSGNASFRVKVSWNLAQK